MDTKSYKPNYLDSDNYVLYIPNAFEQYDLDYFLGTLHEKAQPTRRIFGNPQPRKEIVLTPDGSNWYASNKASKMTERDCYFADLIRDTLDLYLQPRDEPYPSKIWNCNEVEYGPEFKRGGSVGRHQDNEVAGEKLVAIYSTGQPRDLVIDGNGKRLQIKMDNNSLVAMVGPSFQSTYYHRLLKLPFSVAPRTRVSFNARWIV